jgi:hypothetical protein
MLPRSMRWRRMKKRQITLKESSKIRVRRITEMVELRRVVKPSAW